MIKSAFLLIVFLLGLVYWDSFSSPFFQDDFLLLNLSKGNNFFAVLPNFPYRPVSIHLFYSLGRALFDQNVVGFHLLMFAFFTGTLVFLYQIAKKITLSSKVAVLTVFIYSFNVSLFPLFYWVATSYFVLGSFFLFGAIYFYLSKSKNSLLLSAVFLIFGLLSNEIVLVFPGLLLSLGLLTKRIDWKKFTVLTTTSLVYLVFRLVFFSNPASGDYKLDLSLRFFATARWYFLRIFNLPEGVDRQGVIPILLMGILLIIVFSQVRKFSLNWLAFALIWFFVGALPFFFLPNHMSAYYLTISLFGPSLFLAKILNQKKLLLLIFLVIYLFITQLGLEFLKQTHWIIQKPINDTILNSYDNRR